MKQKQLQCFFCNKQITANEDFDTEIHFCTCDNCGKYKLTREVFDDLHNTKVYKQNLKNLYLISGYLREMTDKGIDVGLITHSNLNNLFSSTKTPKNLSEKLEKVLLYMLSRTEFFSQEIEIDTTDFAICYGKNEEEYESILNVLAQRGFLQAPRTLNSRSYSLTIDGFEEAELLQKEKVNSNQCFVAMMFNQDMIDIFFNHIRPDIKEKTGYDAFIVSMKEHNDNICDEIIAGIRKSKFLIADFTGQKGGVYFEAGFAYGLGLPVIWTCKSDEVSKLHFDVSHYNFILWETPEELSTKLCNRILATIV